MYRRIQGFLLEKIIPKNETSRKEVKRMGGQATGFCFNELNYSVILVEKLDDQGRPTGWYGLPGGKLEGDETPEQGFRREWKEEVGGEKEFGPLKFRLAKTIPRTGSEGPYLQHFFIVEETGKKLRKYGKEGESGPPLRISIEQIVSGKIIVFPKHILSILIGMQILYPGQNDDATINDLKKRLRGYLEMIELRKEQKKTWSGKK